MATLFWGDGTYSTLDGNWNNKANWFLTLAPGCCVGGTPANRIPTTGDTVVLAGAGASPSSNITIGPTIPFTGPVSWLNAVTYPVILGDGLFSGAVTVGHSTGGGA